MTDLLIETCIKADIKPRIQKGNNKTSNPWFDVECEKIKKSIKNKCRKLRKNPTDNSLRNDISSDNKYFKKLVQKKKDEYKKGILKDMLLKKGDKKLFWKLLDKLKKQKEGSFKHHISASRWNEHFKSILMNEKCGLTLPPDSQGSSVLDNCISQEEIQKASYILRTNKASGYDSVSNEMILGLIQVQPGIIAFLFNIVFKNHRKIDEWTTALISPIFKSGIETDPGNYRGISVLSCLGKLFSSILNQRLLKFVLDKNILSQEKLGFNRTSDAHLILHNLIQMQCHKNGQKYILVLSTFERHSFDSIYLERYSLINS